jgi:NAD(P)-dependent dehydrogenase (short-subunit alcohol dehydrogenase family)
MKISDMNIVITGANGAVGSILMKYFSKRAAFVAGTIRQLSKNIEKKHFAIIEMDPLNHYSIESTINLINNEAGEIHVWMNIVGGFMMGRYVDNGEHDAWNYMYNTNFMTTLNCCQKILPKMKAAGFGRIVNMGSQSAVRGMPLAGAYCISKVAVHTLTKIIALENGGSITCNAILPDIIDTPANRQKMPNADYSNWTSLNQIAVQIEGLLVSDENGVLIPT